jgi:hypothetical protein
VLKVFNGRPKNGYLDAYTRVLLLRDKTLLKLLTSYSNYCIYLVQLRTTLSDLTAHTVARYFLAAYFLLDTF